MNTLRDKVALIAGGTGGVGIAIAQALRGRGCGCVILVGRDEARGRRVADDLGAGVDFACADAGDPNAATQLAQRIGATHGRIDIVVSATAGPALPRPFAQIAPHDIASTLLQQALAPMMLASAMLPLLQQSGGGSIVLIASDAAKVPTPGETVIGAAMVAITGFARTLAMEVKRDNIRVNAVTPSLVAGTALHDRLMADPFSARLFDKVARAAHLGVATPADVAELVAFLCDPAAARITGQVVSVNGGVSAG